MNKKSLSERDICTKFITPALTKSGWDVNAQIREEVTFTKGRYESAGINRHRVGDERALHERITWIHMAPSHARADARLHVRRDVLQLLTSVPI